LLRLAFLAPEIVEAIAADDQPPKVTADDSTPLLLGEASQVG